MELSVWLMSNCVDFTFPNVPTVIVLSYSTRENRRLSILFDISPGIEPTKDRHAPYKDGSKMATRLVQGSLQESPVAPVITSAYFRLLPSEQHECTLAHCMFF